MDAVCFNNGSTHNAMSFYQLHFVSSYPSIVQVQLPGRQTINRAHLQALLGAIQVTTNMSQSRLVDVGQCSG